MIQVSVKCLLSIGEFVGRRRVRVLPAVRISLDHVAGSLIRQTSSGHNSGRGHRSRNSSHGCGWFLRGETEWHGGGLGELIGVQPACTVVVGGMVSKELLEKAV